MARHLITSALPYVNGTKHLGNVVSSLLPADVTARHLRREGHDVLFLCGTDEHGAATEIAAAATGEAPAALCARYHGIQRDLFARLGLSFDHFGRTSSTENQAATLEVYGRLKAAGLIERRTLSQLYSPSDGRYLPDRYVRGTCPRCRHPDARGDQCEACSALLDPAELIAPRSALSGATDLEARDSEHLFLKLSALQGDVADWVATVSSGWPALSTAVAQSWLAEGLRDRCITRDLSWGVPVPDLPGKVFYCWFDAPIGYIGITREWAAAQGRQEAAAAWWSVDADVTIHQFLGKDNLPFHTVLFPGVLLGAGGLRTPDHVVGTHWLNWYGQKFSTSDGRGVFLDEALALLPAEVWRWALLAQTPEAHDSRFTWDLLARTVNKDLVGGYGNFFQRVLKLARRDGGAVPSGGQPGPREAELAADCAAALDRLRAALGRHRFRDAVDQLRQLWRLGNLYIDERAPWSLRRTDPDAAAVVVRTCVQLIRVYAAAASPILPDSGRRVFAALGLPDAGLDAPLSALSLEGLGGQPFTVPEAPLFDRIDAAVLEARHPAG